MKINDNEIQNEPIDILFLHVYLMQANNISLTPKNRINKLFSSL